jgi:arylsulfatase A-like enzyme
MNFQRMIRLVLLGWVLAAGGVVGAAPAKNVLFLIADDLNNFLGCYGDPLVKTPNLDRLASRGALFRRAYCSYPLCGPSRNSLLTGLYPNATGIYQNVQIFRQSIPEHLSLPQVFRQAGGFAARIGKLYHYNVPNSVGTNGHDDPASWELEINPAGVERTEEHPYIFTLSPGKFGGTLSWYASPKPDRFHTDAMQAEDAEWVLERCAARRDRPFFLAVGFFRPHTPYVSPRSYFDLYPEEEMPVVTGVEADQADLPSPALATRKREEEDMSDALRRQCRQAYLASITFMDAQVGRVLDALERLGLAEDTVIVFTSDHGYHMGEHGLWQKRSLFEESARVPLLIAAPGISHAGSVVESPVSQVDLYPTLMELCGLEGPAGLPGQSLVPLLRNPAAPGRGWALTQVNRRSQGRDYFGYSLRTERYRYTEWDGGEMGVELYDHQEDPGELKNLAKEDGTKELRGRLSRLMAEAVRGSYPESGLAPEVRPGLWTPILVAP